MFQAHAEAAAQHSYGGHGHGAWRRKRDLYGAGHGGYGGALGNSDKNIRIHVNYINICYKNCVE